jgi:hypothetical protein
MIFIIVIIVICCLFIPANNSKTEKNENTETNNVIIETQLPRSVTDEIMMHQVIK